MFTRKSLFVALTVIAMLAMLVPVASAAPEWVHGIKITSPTAADPAYVNPEASDNSVSIAYDLSIVGTQVDNVHVWWTLLQDYDVDFIGKAILTDGTWIPAANLQTTLYKGSAELAIDDSKAPFGEVQDGWYAIQVCAADIDPARPVFCDVQDKAVLVQDSRPVVDLEKPGPEPEMFEGAAFVTGQDYYLQGIAKDTWGVVKVEFQYCDASNFPGCNLTSDSWITIAAGTPVAGVKNQYKATWDSSKVPDDFGFIRMCAWNHVGLSNCATGPDDSPWDQPRQDAHMVFVNNRAVIHLEPGWNLISLPILPYVTAVDDATGTGVLSHLISHKTLGSVQAYDASTKTWAAWNEGGPSNLTEMMDGKGYWVFMKAEDDLTVVGTWKSVGNVVPPEYPVYKSWNLIGYTHWGTPVDPAFPSKTAVQYLSTNSPAMKAMWRYDAEHEVYVQTLLANPMTIGAGYWLALAQDGSINP